MRTAESWYREWLDGDPTEPTGDFFERMHLMLITKALMMQPKMQKQRFCQNMKSLSIKNQF